MFKYNHKIIVNILSLCLSGSYDCTYTCTLFNNYSTCYPQLIAIDNKIRALQVNVLIKIVVEFCLLSYNSLLPGDVASSRAWSEGFPRQQVHR